MELEEFEIRGAVDDYIRGCLTIKSTTLAKKILARKDIAKATKYTYWQKECIPLFPEEKFSSPVTVKNIWSETTPWIVQKIQKYINSDTHALAVFEEHLVHSTSRWLNMPDAAPYFTSEIDFYKGKEVYYFVDQRYCTQHYIEYSLNQSGEAGPYSTTALIYKPEEINIEKGMQFSEHILERLAEKVDHLVFGAFDLDGYIICSFGEKL